MTSEQWDQIEQIFEEAQTRPKDERDAFLREACDDTALQQEVASLLAMADEANDYFDRLASAMSPAMQELREREGLTPGADGDPLDLEGARIDRYAVEEHLGGGGMGVVYRARDTRLGRPVALKFLPPYLAASAEAEKRFIREAKAAATLDHPHIATIYEIGETDEGLRFIAMAYYAGETLKAKLSREDPLPVAKAVGYAIQIADGLSQAHEVGIIHRDVKPANVMVTKADQVKLLDFGLARAAGQTRLTAPDQRMGTAAYMSPEQARGEAVDTRTDLWALGTVLYEMLTGERPFRGGHPAAVLHAILHEAPEPIGERRGEVPPELQAIVDRCLQKDPEARCSSVAELKAELRQVQQTISEAASVFPPRTWPSSPRLSTQMRRITLGMAGLVIAGLAMWLASPALEPRMEQSDPVPYSEETRFGAALGAEHGMVVLPCTGEEQASSRSAFCTGLMAFLTDQLVQLQRSPGVWVVPAEEVRRRGITAPTEAQQLYNTDLILTGTTRREEESVRVRLRLLDGSELEEVDTAELDPPVANLTVLQNEAAASVAEMLDAELPLQDGDELAQTGTFAPRAYETYLQGRGYLWWYEEEDNLSAAIDAFQRSAEEDPVYARAHSGLCESYWRRYETTGDTQWMTKAEQLCERALTLNDQLVEAYRTRGLILRETEQYEEAVRVFQRARALRPQRADLYRHLASTYAAEGDLEKAESTYQNVIYRWPDYWVGYDNLGDFYRNQGYFEAAATQYREAVDAAPRNWGLYEKLAVSYLFLSELDEARELFEDLLEEHPNYGTYSNLGTIYFQDGRYAEATQMFEEALDLKNDDYRLWGNLAAAHYWAGAREKARGYYERAAQMAEQERKTEPQNPVLLSHLGGYYAMLGRHDRALSLTEKAVTLAPNNSHVAITAAATYEQLDLRDQALEWAKKALDRGYPRAFIERMRGLRELRADPRFQSMLTPGKAPS